MFAKCRRVGRFKISTDLLDRYPNEPIKTLMQQVCIVDAQPDIYSGTVMYLALSEHFREIPVGHASPFYEASVTKQNDGKIDIQWKEIEVFHQPDHVPIIKIKE